MHYEQGRAEDGRKLGKCRICENILRCAGGNTSAPLLLLSSHLGQAARHPEPQAVLLPLKAALPPGGVPQEQIYPQSCQSPQSSPQLCYIRNIQNTQALTPL